MYNDIDYARQKLVNTVVLFDGKAALIQEISSNRKGMVAVASLRNGEQVEAPLDQFTIRGFKLGYINGERECYYTLRLPLRSDWRQGLRERNTQYSTGGRFCNASTRRIMEAVEGGQGYPSFVDALTKVREQGGAVAFSPSCCLRSERGRIVLYFRA